MLRATRKIAEGGAGRRARDTCKTAVDGARFRQYDRTMIHRTLSTSSMLTLDQIDLADIDFFVHGDMYEAFAVLREQAPVHWQERVPGRGFWSITRYDDVQSIYRDPLSFSSE